MMESEVWQQLKAGSKGALEQIYRTHIQHLLAYGYRFTSDQVLIEDCIHDLFLELWKNRGGLSHTNAVRPYLLVALRRKIIRKLQKVQKQSNQTPEKIDFEVELAIDEQMIAQETSEFQHHKIQLAFNQLSKRQKEAIYLKFYEDMDYDGICRAMGISYQSARNLVFNGIKALKKYYITVITFIILSGIQ